MKTALLIVGLFIVLEILNYIYLYLFFNLRFISKGLIFGIFLHEFAHLVFCKLTGAKVYEFRVSNVDGVVKHSPSKIILIGDILISLAPLFVGVSSLILSIIFLSSLTYDEFYQMALVTNDFTSLYNNFLLVLKSFDYNSWYFWIFIFFAFNVLATFKPSHQDLKNIFFAIVLYFYLANFSFMAVVNMFLFYSFSIAIILQIIAIVILLPLFFIKPLRK